MTGVIADPRMLNVLEMIARGLEPAAIARETGMSLIALDAGLARLAACGLVRRARRGGRPRWVLDERAAAWLAQGYEIAASLRPE